MSGFCDGGQGWRVPTRVQACRDQLLHEQRREAPGLEGTILGLEELVKPRAVSLHSQLELLGGVR